MPVERRGQAIDIGSGQPGSGQTDSGRNSVRNGGAMLLLEAALFSVADFFSASHAKAPENEREGNNARRPG